MMLPDYFYFNDYQISNNFINFACKLPRQSGLLVRLSLPQGTCRSGAQDELR